MAESTDRFLMNGDVTCIDPKSRWLSTLKIYLKQKVFDERLGNWLGVLYAVLGGLLFAVVLGFKGLQFGIVLIGGIVGIPIIFATIFNPMFGVVFIISISYCLLGIKRFMPDVPVGIAADFLVVILAFGIFFKNLYKKDWTFAQGAISKMVFIYMIYVFASVANPAAQCKLCYIYTIRSMAGYMIMYFLVSYVIRTKRDIRFLIKLWLLLSFLAALYAYKQEYLGLTSWEDAWVHADDTRFWLIFQWGRLRKFSFMADPTSFGICMGYSALIAIILAFAKISKLKKVILLVMAFSMLQSMLFSGTRAAFVILPIGAMMYVILAKSRKIIYLAAIGAISLIIIINLPMYINTTFQRFQSAFKATEDASFIVRLENQKRIRPWVWKHPLGGGLGATGVWGARFAPNAFLSGFPPDSGYVRAAVELGWIGLTLYMLLWIVIFKQGIDSYFRIRDPVLKYISLAMLCVLFSLFIVNYPQEAIKQIPTSLLFWVAAAILNRSSQIDREEQSET